MTNGPQPSPAQWADTDLEKQRNALRRGLRRANLASVFILMLLVALALGFVWKARQSVQQAVRAREQAQRANAEAERAREASTRAEDELWKAHLNEARARRIAGGPGARVKANEILSELVRRPDLPEEQVLALRQEAIAQLALVDVAPSADWVTNQSNAGISWDGSLTRYVQNGSSREVQVREYPSGRVVASFSAPNNAAPRYSVFTPDGRLLATRFSSSDVLVWEIESGNLALKTRCVSPPGFTRALMSSPDSRTLLMYTTNGLVVQSLETNGVARPLFPGRRVLDAVFTHDSRRLAVAPADARSVVEVWDVASGAMLNRFDVGFETWTFEWHPDGQRLAVSGDYGRLGIWNVSSNPPPREVLRLEGHVGAVTYTMFAPDGSSLVTHSWDTLGSVWDLVSGQRILAETRFILNGFNRTGERVILQARGGAASSGQFHARTGFRTAAWTGGPTAITGTWLSPDSRLLLVSTPNDCRLWDFEGGREIALFAGMWGQFSGDGQALFIFTKEALHRYELTSALLRSADEFKPEIVFRAPAGQRLHGGFLSPDGRTLTIGLATGGTVLLDVEKNTMTRHPGVRSHDAELSPDGAMLAARLHNYPVLLVNATNGSTITQMVGVAEVVFSPDGKWILAKTQDKLRLLERASLALAREWHLDVGAGGPPSVAFSPDSATLAVAHNRFDARLLEISSGRELATFSPPHPGQVGASRSITFSRNGRWLVVGKQDGEVVAWDLPVVRAELARLGLNWGETLNPVLNSDVDLSAGSESKPDNKLAIKSGEVSPAVAAVSEQSLGALATSSPALSIAFGAIALALTAGLFISLHQRRMLSAYARAEALAIEQQQKLQIAQEELQHSQKMRALGTLAAGIAHDFNNLLSIIRLSNQLAAEQTQATGTAKENIDAIESAVAQGETIVQSMLGYSRAAAELESEYSVAAAVSETVAMLGRKFLAGIVLQLEIQPDIPAVRGVRGRLEQMLLNLVVNASDAMNSRGTLRLTANIVFDASACLLKPKPAREYVCISVGDSGPGISAEALPRIFEPFFTTKSAGARPGTGLGLSTVYTMAQQDGVGLAVETSAGRGTTFQILVPVAEGERNKPTAKPASVP